MKETHVRTLAKTVIYRILSVIAIVLLSLAFGASDSVAGVLGFGAVVLGTIAYYAHDRVWLKFSWLTTDAGESKWRSLIKSVTYRLIVMAMAFTLAKIFLTASTATALAFTVAQMVINFVLFYIVERVFNFISWGKINSDK